MLHRRSMRESMIRERLSRGFDFDHGFQTTDRFDSQWERMSFSVPETDILELDDRYVLELALPGVVLDDVEIRAEDYTLSVVAKRTPNMFEERATYLRKELPCHFMVREFEFEDEILIEEIEARLDRGILFISIPKVEAAVRIPVSAGSLEGHLFEGKTRMHKDESRKVTVK